MQSISYEQHKELQFVHWWFEGRRKIVEKLMRKHIPGTVPVGRAARLRVLDVGSGFGSMIPMLRKFGQVSALEPFDECSECLVALGANPVYKNEVDRLVVQDKYDIVTMFDVLEHIEDDYGALAAIRKNLLAEDGIVVLTVPAYRWLWSSHDDFNHHFRRYDERSIRIMLSRCGFSIIRMTYFMCFLFVPGAIQRLTDRLLSTKVPRHESGMMLNDTLRKIFSSESSVVVSHNFAFGLSLFAMCRVKHGT